MARRRYQAGCLFKRGRRRKVWVARWREDVLLEGGQLGRLHRSVVLGTVGKPDDSKWRVLEPGKGSLAVDGEPYVARILGSEFVEPERSQEADDTVGHTNGSLSQGVMVGDIGVQGRVRPTADSGQFAMRGESAQVFGMESVSLKIQKPL